MSSSTRVRPNAFHFRRQVLILQRAGGGSAESQFKDSGSHCMQYCYSLCRWLIPNSYLLNSILASLVATHSCSLICQEWSQATSIARAFNIGRGESEAVSALMSTIPQEIVTTLEDAVRARGMQRFILHEVLSKGIFASAWTSGTGAAEAWKDELRNRDDNLLAPYLKKGVTQ